MSRSTPNDLHLDELVQRFPELLHGLSASDREALVTVLETRDLVSGEVLITEGERSEVLYLLLTGRLTVEIVGVGVLAERGPGEIFGEVALLDPGPASATVRALGPARLLSLSATALDAIARAQPHLTANLLRELCRTMADRNAESDARCDDIVEAQRVRSGQATFATPESAHPVLDALRHVFTWSHRSGR